MFFSRANGETARKKEEQVAHTPPKAKKTLPSRYLFATKDPLPWVSAVATDVTRWRNK